MNYFDGCYFDPAYFDASPCVPVVTDEHHGGMLLDPPPGWLPISYQRIATNGPLYPERRRRRVIPDSVVFGTVTDVLREMERRRNAEDEWVLGLITEWEN